MRNIILLFITGVLTFGLSGCGTKGKLKTPAQVEAQEAKEEAQRAKQAQEQAAEQK